MYFNIQISFNNYFNINTLIFVLFKPLNLFCIGPHNKDCSFFIPKPIDFISDNEY